jgi:hypothetical protein
MEHNQNWCIVSHLDNTKLVPSHIVPRQLGNFLKFIAQWYVHTAQPPITNRWDPQIGIIINTALDTSFDSFNAGLFHDPVSEVCCLLQSVG